MPIDLIKCGDCAACPTHVLNEPPFATRVVEDAQCAGLGELGPLGEGFGFHSGSLSQLDAGNENGPLVRRAVR